MKTVCIGLLIGAITGCTDKAVTPMEVEAAIGEPFEVSTPASITFRETGIVVTIEVLSGYIYPAFNPPIVSATGHYKNQEFTVKHTVDCDDPGYFRLDFTIDGEYVLRYEEVVASTIVEDRDGTDIYRVDRARFTLKPL